jgi:microcystin-dependent protein
LSDGSTNDDVTITAGSNITIDPVASGGFTISAVADGSGGILSDVDVVQENYECTNPITTATNAGITTITIGEDSNAYGTRYVQATEPTGVCDGDIWYDTSGASGSSDIPSGSVMLFVQASAPTGWTKLTSHNNKALRIVSGTGGGSGGSTAFTTVFSSRTTTGSVDPHTLTISQMPSHSHTMRNTGSDNLNDGSFVKNFNYITNTGTGSATGSTGGNGSHSHGFTGGTMDFAVQYVDAIICQKN